MRCRGIALVLLAPFIPDVLQAQDRDWPMWRYDAGRSAVSPHALSDQLHLQWVREYPRLKPAWPYIDPGPGRVDTANTYFDAGYEPVVTGKTLLVASSRSDRLEAIDTDTGLEKWVFYADGPIRFA